MQLQVFLTLVTDLPDALLFVPQRICIVDHRVGVRHRVHSAVFQRRGLDDIGNAIRACLHFHVCQLLLFKLVLVVAAKGVQSRGPRPQLPQLIHILALLALHLKFVAVIKALPPLVTHVEVGDLLRPHSLDPFLLLFKGHLPFEAGELLAHLARLFDLVGHLRVVLLLLPRLFEAQSLLLAHVLLVLAVLLSPLFTVNLGLLALGHLHLGEALLVLALAVLSDHEVPLRLLHLLVHLVGSFILVLQQGGPLVVVALFVLGVVLGATGLATFTSGFFLELGRVLHAVGAHFERVKLQARIAEIGFGC